MSASVEIRPQPGPQEAFLASPADIVFYGGEAGGGKTAGLTLEGMRNHDVRGAGGIIFRRTSPQLEGPGSLWELMNEWYPALGARLTQNPFKAVFPSGASLQLAHLQHEEDKYSHQGKGYVFIGFDELPHFTESQVWYLWSRARSTSGVRPYMRATMNPEPDSWVKKWIEWYLDDEGRYVRPERSGVIRYFYRVDDALDWDTDIDALKARHPEQVNEETGEQLEPTSFTFIHARLSDNKILTHKDPTYRAKLMSLPKVERERLAAGDWKIKPAAGLYFKRIWFKVIDAPPTDLVAVGRGWDKAATEPSPENPEPAWTRGVKLGVTSKGRFVVLHMESLRGSPHKVDTAMQNTASQDGKNCKIMIWQDPGAAGKVDVRHTKSVLIGYRVESEVAREDKITYAGPVSTQVEAGNVDVLRGPWNDEFFAELEGFPDGKFKDIVDALSRAFLGLHKAGVLAYQTAMQNISAEFGE